MLRIKPVNCCRPTTINILQIKKFGNVNLRQKTLFRVIFSDL